MNAVLNSQIEERARWSARRQRLGPSQPQGFFVEPECDGDGCIVSVATIFLTNRECPWRCLYCDLWKNTTTETVPRGAIPAQIDFALAQIGRDELRESHSDHSGTRGTHPSTIEQIKLYNAGSFFDPKAIPPADFPAIAERLSGFKRVIVECHPALIGESTIRFQRLLKGPQLEVAMGLEIADDVILQKLNKRMSLEMFRRAAEFLKSNGIAIRAFVILKPPYVRTDAAAFEFAQRSIDFAFDCGATAVSVIPARTGPIELEELAARGEFSPPRLATLETILAYGVQLRRGRVFADLWNIENLADCAACFDQRRARLHSMNLNQSLEPEIECGQCAGIPRADASKGK